MPSNHMKRLDKALQDCHNHELDWTLLPTNLKEVSEPMFYYFFFFQFFNGMVIAKFTYNHDHYSRLRFDALY